MGADEPFDIFRDARGVQQASIKAANERTVLALVAAGSGVSGAEIARRSGLGPQTVSRILSNFEDRGFIRRGDVLRGKRGQPATPIYLVPECAYAIGCEVSWRHMSVLLMDMGGTVLSRRRADYSFPEPDRVLAEIVEGVAALRTLMPDPRRLAALGLAAPGAIDRVVGQFGAGPEVGGAWQEFDLKTRVAEATGIPTAIFNDGNAACWSELMARRPPRPASFVYFLISTNLATGIVSQGRLWNGNSRQGANLGAMIVDDRHGGHVLVNSIASLETLGRVLTSWGMDMPSLEAESWAEASLEPALARWIEDAARALAHAIANAVVVADVGLAVIDGLLPRDVLDRLAANIRRRLESVPQRSMPPPNVEIGHKGALAPALGAAELAIYQKFFAGDWQQLRQ